MIINCSLDYSIFDHFERQIVCPRALFDGQGTGAIRLFTQTEPGGQVIQ